MPPAPDRPPEPTTLHRAFEQNGPLDWGKNLATTADIARLHGIKATTRSLRLLEQAVTVEPRTTAQFLAALPSTASPYKLDRRIKSPESLARKIRNWEGSDTRRPVDDILRYTVLTDTPEDLVAAARNTADELTGHGWRVTYAMHSYTEGSRYKGIHAYLRTPDIPRVEVQFHSVASVKVKELTTRWYEIERSVHATDDERAAARQQCVEASGRLSPPRGISDMATLGGRIVAVNNYSDSRRAPAARERAHPSTAAQHTRQTKTLDRNGGTAR